jgi:hypothetical protein
LTYEPAVLKENLEEAFCHRDPDFRPTNDDQVLSEAARRAILIVYSISLDIKECHSKI